MPQAPGGNGRAEGGGWTPGCGPTTKLHQVAVSPDTADDAHRSQHALTRSADNLSECRSEAHSQHKHAITSLPPGTTDDACRRTTRSD